MCMENSREWFSIIREGILVGRGINVGKICLVISQLIKSPEIDNKTAVIRRLPICLS